jgi:hypothetical protein
MTATHIPCGGCGATDSSQRCIGCLHQFLPEQAQVVVSSLPLIEQVRKQAELLVSAAALGGVVLTISQAPLRPLAMRNYETVVSVRHALERAA